MPNSQLYTNVSAFRRPWEWGLLMATPDHLLLVTIPAFAKYNLTMKVPWGKIFSSESRTINAAIKLYIAIYYKNCSSLYLAEMAHSYCFYNLRLHYSPWRSGTVPHLHDVSRCLQRGYNCIDLSWDSLLHCSITEFHDKFICCSITEFHDNFICCSITEFHDSFILSQYVAKSISTDCWTLWFCRPYFCKLDTYLLNVNLPLFACNSFFYSWGKCWFL